MRHLLLLFLFFIVLMGLPDWYIYRRYVSRWKQVWMRRLYWLPSTLLLIGMFITFGTYEPRPEAMNRLSLLLIVFLCINVPKAIFALLSPLCKSHIGLAIALFTMAYLVFGATEGKQHFQVKEVTIESEALPRGFDGYRIVQLSDIHTGSWGNDTAPMLKAVNIINRLQPDLIVFTGDLVMFTAFSMGAVSFPQLPV